MKVTQEELDLLSRKNIEIVSQVIPILLNMGIIKFDSTDNDIAFNAEAIINDTSDKEQIQNYINDCIDEYVDDYNNNLKRLKRG